ncbi:MMPL family transporter [Streptantibioticus ferralitis]|uniref:MMPL family transporter n=1 Tax=Streptantibioticus ferralitis TaxID=236510 RepID=A0ABT5YRN9_9ACTN|nr:MMPL family transporter [Streptantibioticus ferralitis]MDF2254261.1 MMPL family transporter [Streptantibioticus ferralitis]
MAVLARWCLHRRLAVIVLWLAAFAGLTTAAFATGSAYSSSYDVPGTEAGRAAALLGKAFPGAAGSSDTIVWHSAHGTVRAAAVEQRVSHALDQVSHLPGVTGVSNPYGTAARTADGGAAQISRDGHTAYATVTFAKDAEHLKAGQVRQVVATAKAAATKNLQVELGGDAIALTQPSSGQLSEVVGVAVAAVVLFVAFGSLAAMCLPIVTAVVSVGAATMGIQLLSHVMSIANFAPMLGTLIGLGVGIDYALFIVTRHRRGLRRGLDVQEAAERAVATSGRAVVFAGGTVCVAVLGMLVLRLSFLTGVAIAAAMTVLLTVAASVTLLPALLGIIGKYALSKRERRRLAEHGPQPELPTGLAARWSSFVERHPKLLAGVAAVVMLTLAVPVLSMRLGTSDQGNDPATSTTRKAYDLVAHGFGPGVNGPLQLVAQTDDAADKVALDKLTDTLRDTHGVASVAAGTAQRSGDVTVLTVVPSTAPQSQATSDLINRLRHDVVPAAEAGTDLRVQVGGVTAGYDDFASVIVSKLPVFVGVVITLGGVLLLLAFRSLGIPLKAALMNVAAVASSFGVVVAIFQWGWGSELLGLGRAGPIEPFLPVIMVSVLFGLSMDYQVFLVSRMYEEWRETRDNRRAVRIGLAETSRVINSAAVIMISVFLAFVLSGDRVIAMFGIGLAAAVALDAFVLRTLLVPALMHLLGGANWWLPGWLERRLPRISIEAPEAEVAPTPPKDPQPHDDLRPKAPDTA